MAFTIQTYVFALLFLVGFLLSVWAFADAVRRPAVGFTNAEKRTKPFWVAIIAAGVFFGYLAIPPVSIFGFVIGFGLPLLFGLIAVLPGAIYLADVKPEVIRFSPRRPGPSGSSGRW
ncbi:DUF2516 family protein [Litorihabitans aurantiacus]|uniref:DUF2516 family protein n=1 Tax=Litorihabitans aurantiacus TaxID=1930061 RepID=A0AA37XCU3_9MICO|nr:DUF2516 family protein [Litorihabitans aurantiacus]GMA30270.1 hypothetical protein GCM10025875_02620 [Litorihabitans aurantiacus]